MITELLHVLFSLGAGTADGADPMLQALPYNYHSPREMLRWKYPLHVNYRGGNVDDFPSASVHHDLRLEGVSSESCPGHRVHWRPSSFTCSCGFLHSSLCHGMFQS
jgi:hypothetical protein